MFSKLFEIIAKPFIGTGLGEKIPFLKNMYDLLYSSTHSGIKTIQLKEDILFSYSAKDTGLGAFLTLKGEYEPLQTELFEKDLTKSGTFLDIGANIGYYTVIAANSGFNVTAFEPDTENIELLEQNINQNNLRSKVSIETKAVGNTDGSVYFEENEKQKGNSGVSQTETNRKVDSIRLDTYLNTKNIIPSIIKVDIEGFEPQFFEGALQTLKQHNPVIYIEYNPQSLEEQGNAPEELIKTLLELGYKLEVIDEVRSELYPYSEPALKKALSKVPYTNFRCS